MKVLKQAAVYAAWTVGARCAFLIVVSLVMLLLSAGRAHAEVSMDDGTTSRYVFRVAGKVVSPVEAVKAAPSNDVERCTPVKDTVDADGKPVVALKCHTVKLVYKKNTGIPSWKAK